jgi:hypothetical protein
VLSGGIRAAVSFYEEEATRIQCRYSSGVVDVGMKAFCCTEIIV